MQYATCMIRNFADRRTEQIFDGKVIKRLDATLQKKILRRLRYIDAAEKIGDLQIPPSNKLEKKQGDLRNYYSIWVNTQWRIVFRWNRSVAHDVQLVDYH